MPCTTPELVELNETPTAVINGRVPVGELAAFFDAAFSELPAAIAAHGVQIVGPAYARYHGAPTDIAELEVGFPTDRPVEASGRVTPGSLPGGRAVYATHEGGFDQLGDSWGGLAAWAAREGHTLGPSMWEVYVTEPRPDMDPADLRTDLFWPVS